jgi:hypothetical protein
MPIVSLGPILLLMLVQAEAGAVAAGRDPVARALARQGYPWYDPAHDRFQPIGESAVKPRESLGWLDELRAALAPLFRWLRRLIDWVAAVFGWLNPGGLVSTALLLALLVLVLVVLARLWQPVEPEIAGNERAALAGQVARLLDQTGGVPLSEQSLQALAFERKAAGDLAGAILALFAHELLVLDRLGQIRLAPGRTARRYEREASKGSRGRLLTESLGLFEGVCYGRRSPDPVVFARVWSLFEAGLGAGSPS